MTDDVSFQRAPLIEIVAELRWNPIGMPAPTDGQVQIAIGGADADAFLMAFGRRSEVASFTQAAKLVPSGFPAVWQQIVWRYTDPKTEGVLLQVGPGIFTANALQPYKRWSAFRPTVECGVKALIASRLAAEREQPFTGLSLRYINGFSPEIMAGLTPSKFIRDVLKFNVEAPEAITDHYDPNAAGSTSLNLLIPVANTSKVMSVNVGDGTIRQSGSIADSPAVMLDVTVSENKPVDPTVEAVMASLDASRNIIHNTFLKLTDHIKDRMKPVYENTNA